MQSPKAAHLPCTQRRLRARTSEFGVAPLLDFLAHTRRDEFLGLDVSQRAVVRIAYELHSRQAWRARRT
jgi:hypothetical protein